jgi:hypothetical protein
MSAAAAHCCTSVVSFSRLLDLGIIERQARDVGYDLDVCRAARFKYLENRDGGAALSAQRAKLATAQTVAVERRNAVDAGDLVSIAVVRRDLEADFAVMREISLSLPGKVADSLTPHCAEDRGVITEILRREIREMLENLSDPKSYGEVEPAGKPKRAAKPKPKRAANKPKRAAAK